MQLVGRQTGRAQWADGGRGLGEIGDSPPPLRKPTRSGPPLLDPDPGTPRKEGELCPLEAMLRGLGEPKSWLMDCSPPPAAWELPPPLEEEAWGELGSLEEVVAECTEPSPAASSLGSWADECERANAALAAAEAQMGQGCLEESPEGNAALDGDLLMEEDCEWMVALGGALAPPRRGWRELGVSRRAGKELPSLSKGRRRPRGARRNQGRHRGRGQQPPRGERPPPKGPLPGRSLAALTARETRKRMRSRW